MKSSAANVPVAANHGVLSSMSKPRSGDIRQSPTTTASLRRPGSALRRLPIQQQQQAFAGNVSLEFRPLTQHGMMGMRSGDLGPGRQFADKPFFIAEIRNKITQVQDEYAKLSEEIEHRSRDQQSQNHNERQYETLYEEVQALEGQLADLNLAHDKVRTGVDVGELQQRCTKLAELVANESIHIDQMFLHRANQDKLSEQIENEINAIKSKEEEMISESGHEVYDEYVRLQDEAKQVTLTLYRNEDALSALQAKKIAYEHQMKIEKYQLHTHGLQLQKEIVALEHQRSKLLEETSSNLTVDQMRDGLLARTKEDATLVKVTEHRIHKLEQSIEQLQEKISDKEMSRENTAELESLRGKYEALYERDRKMQSFIDAFEFNKQNDAQEKQRAQSFIVAVLEHISLQKAQKNSSDIESWTRINEDLDFKTQRLENSHHTLSAIQQELKIRRDELNKVQSLGEKASAEIESLSATMKSMSEDMERLTDIEALQKREGEQKAILEHDLHIVQHKQTAMQLQVQNISTNFDSLKQSLSHNDTWSRLCMLEQKHHAVAQITFTLHSYVKARTQESEYESLREEVLDLVQRVNDELVKNSSG